MWVQVHLGKKNALTNLGPTHVQHEYQYIAKAYSD
jgi:hypothetical protein